jgi:hypothetical protein
MDDLKNKTVRNEKRIPHLVSNLLAIIYGYRNVTGGASIVPAVLGGRDRQFEYRTCAGGVIGCASIVSALGVPR